MNTVLIQQNDTLDQDIIAIPTNHPHNYCEYSQILERYKNFPDWDAELQYIAFLSDN